MKNYFLWLFTSVGTLFILISFTAVPAEVSITPLLAVLGSGILLILGTTFYLYRPKWGALVSLIGVLLMIPWLGEKFLGSLSDLVVCGLSEITASSLAIPFLPLALALLSGITTYRILFTRKDILWNSTNPNVTLVLKIFLTLIPLSGLLWWYFATLSDSNPYPSLFPGQKFALPRQELANRGNRENLLVAVAPLATYKLPADAGVSMRDKIALHMEKDLGLKVLKLSAPVSMKPYPQPYDIQAGTENAEKILVASGADLLVWGNEDVKGDGKEWTVNISASARAQCLARDAGFSIHETTDLDNVAEADLLEVLDWATWSWRGLIQESEGMYIAKTMEPMVNKIDTILGLVAEKRMGPQALLAVKSNLAFILSEYGIETKDPKALTNAIRLARETVAKPQVEPETGISMADLEAESILGRSLFTLGTLQNNPQLLAESVQIDQEALKGLNPKYDKENWAVMQTCVGFGMAQLGQKLGDHEKIRQAIPILESVEKLTDPRLKPHLWLCIQTGLGASYTFLGVNETNLGDLKKAIPHFLSAEQYSSEARTPEDYAETETNLSQLYFSLGEREHSAEDLRQSVAHGLKAVDLFRRMGNNYALAFSLCNLGKTQEKLSYFIDDDAMLDLALKNLAKSQELVPRAQDVNLWSECQVYKAIGGEYKGAKTFDPGTFQEASNMIEGLKTTYTRQTGKTMWIELCMFQTDIEILRANLACDILGEKGVLQTLEDIRAGLDAKENALRVVQIDDGMGRALAQEGIKEKNPASLRKAISFLEEALSLANQGDLGQIQCSIRSDLVYIYAKFLTMDPNPQVAQKAREQLGLFESHCLASEVVMNVANHNLDAAELERALAMETRDKAALLKGRTYAVSSFKLYGDHHYPFFAARSQKELGDADLLLAQWTGDKTALQNAMREYKEAEKTFESYGGCWAKEVKEKLLEAQELAGK